MATTLFEPAGHGWRSTELARGPWDPRHCHGGPVSALLARAAEQLDDHVTDREGNPIEWNIARLTVELSHPVPVGETVTVEASIERAGRRVSVVGTRLADERGTTLVMARALRIRRLEWPMPSDAGQPHDTMPELPGSGADNPVHWAPHEEIAFHKNANHFRFVEGSGDELGPVAVWISLLAPLVPDEPVSGLQRVAAATDFGNGVSAAVDGTNFAFINPDLTIHLARPPVGDWIGLRSASYLGTETTMTGAGLAESALYDTAGRFGRSVQSLFVAPH